MFRMHGRAHAEEGHAQRSSPGGSIDASLRPGTSQVAELSLLVEMSLLSPQPAQSHSHGGSG